MAVATKRAASAHLATLVKYVAAAYLVREHIAEFTICVGPSMMPTFDPSGEVALVERMFLATTLRNRPIQKGDIVRIDVSPITRPLGHSVIDALVRPDRLPRSFVSPGDRKERTERKAERVQAGCRARRRCGDLQGRDKTAV